MAMASTGLASIDQLLGGDGYPAKSVVIVIGPLGIGKEALCYWFTRSGLEHGDFCLYITRLSVSEIIQDAKGFGVEFQSKVPFWFAVDGSSTKYNLNDLTLLSHSIKEFLRQNKDRRTRIVIDSLSSLLMLNPPETIYRFLTQLFSEIKQYDSVLVATLEEGMHPPQVIAAMGQLFDGVLELRMYEEGLRAVPLLKVRKMRGIPPKSDYFTFNFSNAGMELARYDK
jgi:KaiC/GvpD/RAD55 family RecA-like ATPase